MAKKKTTRAGPKKKTKMYIIRKYIKAYDASQAIRKDKLTPVHDVWVDETWKAEHLAEAIGFNVDVPEEEEEDMDI